MTSIERTVLGIRNCMDQVNNVIGMSLFDEFMFIFKQQCQALNKKNLTTTACALLNVLAAGGA